MKGVVLLSPSGGRGGSALWASLSYPVNGLFIFFDRNLTRGFAQTGPQLQCARPVNMRAPTFIKG